MTSSEQPEDRPWTTGDPIPETDRESVRNLIYAGFSRRLVSKKLGLHKDLVGKVFDEYAPYKDPKLSEEARARIREMIGNGASLADLAAEYGVSESQARSYARAVGVHPRTVTDKYLREQQSRS